MAANINHDIGQPPLLLLSLDGGGVRGLSAIMILKRIMKTINESRPRGHELEPWQVFDMMGGTSTGGIIALMLGRLRMSLEDCENAYLALSEKIFARKRSRLNFLGHAKDFVQADGKFDSDALEAATKEIIAQVSTKDVLLKEPDGACKVFVVAVRENNSEAALLRSYKNPRMSNFLYDECKVWEACRATSAATTFFAPIQIGKYGQRFVDGAVRYNNPVQLVTREAEAIWPDREQFILSIGTGSAPGIPFKGNLKAIVDALKGIAVETERTADDFHHAHRNMVQDDLLFRFNVYHGLSDVGLEEYKEISAIADATEVYLDHGETMKKLEACIGRLQATIAEECPYVENDSSNINYSKEMYETFSTPPEHPAKFSKSTMFEEIRPKRVEFLCYLNEPSRPELRGVQVKATASTSHELGLFGNTPFVYIDYGTTDFGWESQDLMPLHQAAERATRDLGLPAYWIACSCMPNVYDMEELTWSMCDIIRSAERLVLVIWTQKPGRQVMSIEERLRDWGGRTWSMHPLLLAPRGRPIEIYDISNLQRAGSSVSLPRRSLVDATPADCYSVVRRLIDHYEGTLILGTLDLMFNLLRFLFSTNTIQYLPGDHSYVLMGFLPFRPRPEPTDSAFQAWARVLFTNEVDSFLERWLCTFPTDQSNWTSCLVSPDTWGSQLRDIQPVFKIGGIGSQDTVFVNGAPGAFIEHSDADMDAPSSVPVPQQKIPFPLGTPRPRFCCVKGDISEPHGLIVNLPGPLRISLNSNSAPMIISSATAPWLKYTLIDTYTMTATPFKAARAPELLLVCGIEGVLCRALLCWLDAQTGTLHRESIVRLEARVTERMQKVERVEVAPYPSSMRPQM